MFIKIHPARVYTESITNLTAIHMVVRVTGLDYEVSQDDRAYLDERLASIDRALGQEADRAVYEAEIGKIDTHAHSGTIWKATIAVTYGKEHSFAEATGETVRAAIDAVKDELLNAIRKQRSLHRRLLRKGSQVIKRLVRGVED